MGYVERILYRSIWNFVPAADTGGFDKQHRKYPHTWFSCFPCGKSPFEMELLARMEENETKSAVIGSSAPMQLVSEVPVKFDTSALQETGRALDFAIDGEGFLNIVSPADAADNPGVSVSDPGTAVFALNENKQLELVGAGLVLGEKGVIELKDADFTVEPDGSIYDSRGRYIDRLLVTVPAEGSQTRIAGNGLYLTDNMQGQPAGFGTDQNPPGLAGDLQC